MTNALPRKNEVATLKVLHELGILDTTAEPEFDALVQSAAKVCNMPIALISLLDEDRQWFKARAGFFDITETPRDISFCAHTVLHRDMLEVPDTLLDPRFADNPFVAGPAGIRFYAEAPLSIANGLQIGTLCVLDTTPRRLTEDERTLLKSLATAMAHPFELRLAKRRLKALLASSDGDRSSTAELVVSAMSTLELALDQLFDSNGNVSFTSESNLMALEPAERALVSAQEKLTYQSRPAITAMHLCLTASSTLLGITHDLLHSAQYLSTDEREKAWKKLAADTKIAGRAAYRAALVLADPDANRKTVRTM